MSVVTILPPREGFSPGRAGAVSMIVRRLASPADIIIGRASPGPPFLPGFRPVPRRAWPPGANARYHASAAGLVRALKPALVEVHNRADLALRVARAVPRTPMILFLHNDPQRMRGARSPADRRALLARMRVLCVSGWVQARFMDGLGPVEPVAQRFPNAIDLASLPHPSPPAEREKLVLFVGRAVADKGADSFVRAWGAVRSQLPGWRAALIGADRFGPDSPDTPFLRALRPLAAANGVEMRGWLPHDQVLAELARAAILAVPCRWAEPFGLAALEGMASGAALICAARGGLPEVAGDAALYADPDPPGALETAILTLAQDAALRARLAEAGLARARQFDLPAARERLHALRCTLISAAWNLR